MKLKFLLVAFTSILFCNISSKAQKQETNRPAVTSSTNNDNQLQKQEKNANACPLSDKLLGDWFNNDNKFEWIIGLYDSIVIYKNQIWQYGKLIQSDNKLTLDLLGKHEVVQLQIIEDKTSFVKFADNKSSAITCSKGRPYNAFQSNSATNQSSFNGSADKSIVTIRGIVTNSYARELGSIIISSLWSGRMEVSIDANGYFEVTIPAYLPQVINIHNPVKSRMAKQPLGGLDYPTYVYVSPGSNLMVNLHSIYPPTVATRGDEPKTRETIFMGEDGRINNLISSLLRHGDDGNYLGIGGLYTISATASENQKVENYEAYINQVVSKNYLQQNEMFLSLIAHNSISVQEQTIIKRIMKANYAIMLSRSFSHWEYYKKENNIIGSTIPEKKLEGVNPIVRKKIIEALSDSAYLYAGDYASLAYSLTKGLENGSFKKSITAFFEDQLLNDEHAFSSEEMSLYHLLKAMNAGNIKEDVNIDSLQKVTTQFSQKYKKQIEKFSNQYQDLTKFEIAQKYYQLPDWVHDLMLVNDRSSVVSSAMSSEEDKFSSFKEKAKSKSIIAILNTELKKNKAKPIVTIEGSFIKKTPRYDGEYVLPAIIDEHKGKTILIDFWATWCAPCRFGLSRLAPLKAQLKNEPVAFITITDETSPDEVWKPFVKQVAGYHYKLDNTEWGYLAKKFYIRAIPRYMLVDKDGSLTHTDYKLPDDLNDLKKLLLNKKDE